MKWYNNLKEKYNNIFDSPKKKAALKLSLGIIFFVLASLSLYYDKEADTDINTNKTTTESQSTSKNVTEDFE